MKLYCPLVSIAEAAPSACKKEKCAWWVENEDAKPDERSGNCVVEFLVFLRMG
jgi:hypothetical protein